MVASVNDYQKERQFRRLNARKEDRRVRVVRNFHEKEISVFDVCVGDIFVLEAGEIVPVDGVLLDGEDLVRYFKIYK